MGVSEVACGRALRSCVAFRSLLRLSACSERGAIAEYLAQPFTLKEICGGSIALDDLNPGESQFGRKGL